MGWNLAAARDSCHVQFRTHLTAANLADRYTYEITEWTLVTACKLRGGCGSGKASSELFRVYRSAPTKQGAYRKMAAWGQAGTSFASGANHMEFAAWGHAGSSFASGAQISRRGRSIRSRRTWLRRSGWGWLDRR